MATSFANFLTDKREKRKKTKESMKKQGRQLLTGEGKP